MKNTAKILVFALLMASGTVYSSNISQQNTVSTTTTITKTRLFKEYICSTFGVLLKTGSVIYSIASIGAILMLFDGSKWKSERANAFTFLTLSGLPMTIILWKTGGFLEKLGKI